MAHVTNFSFEFFFLKFSQKMPLYFNTMVQKGQKWPKTQIKGGPALNISVFSFNTMVIKLYRELRGESAFGNRSASSLSKCSAGMNSDFGNGSFWVEICDTEHVDRCSWRSTQVWSHQLTSDLKTVYFFWKWPCLKQFRCLRLSWEACVASRTLRASCSFSWWRIDWDVTSSDFRYKAG